MPFTFSVGNCQKTLSEVTIWPRYDIKREDKLELKVTFLMNISTYRSLWIMEVPNGSWCVLMGTGILINLDRSYLVGYVRSGFVLKDSASTDRFWRVLRDPGGTDKIFVMTLPDPLVPKRIHQYPPESISNLKDQSVPSRIVLNSRKCQFP